LIHLFISDTGGAHWVATPDDEDTLAPLQTMVDGLIEYHPCVKALQGLDCWVNEEGGFRIDFFTNYVASYETNLPLRGSAVLSRSNDQGETVGLTDDDIKKITDLMDVSYGLYLQEGSKHFYLHNHRTERRDGSVFEPDEFMVARFGSTSETVREYHDRQMEERKEEQEYKKANSL